MTQQIALMIVAILAIVLLLKLITAPIRLGYKLLINLALISCRLVCLSAGQVLCTTGRSIFCAKWATVCSGRYSMGRICTTCVLSR